MFRLICLVAALVFAPVAQAGGGFTSGFAGNWRGVGVQADGAHWDMQLTLGPTLGMVSYPELKCGGTWKFTEERVNGLLATERIDYGREYCIETGNVLLLPYGTGQMLYVWCGPDENAGAVAVLARAGASMADYAAQLAATEAALQGLAGRLETLRCDSTAWLGV